MKKGLLHIVLLLMSCSLAAQNEYRPFKVDVGFLLGEANEHNIGLVAPYVEPKFNISNHFTLGMRVEYTFYRKDGFIDYDPDDPYVTDLDAAGWTFSSLATVDYYFNDNYVRPFFGIGAGVYYMYINQENNYIPSFSENGLAFGYMPRAGLNIGQFRFSCEYNIIKSEEFSLDYLSLKIGYEIGGGKKWF